MNISRIILILSIANILGSFGVMGLTEETQRLVKLQAESQLGKGMWYPVYQGG